ncbi:HIT-like protein [Trichodelitschia bisporula]|uniref:HIT-like protein n=1 Tax=Trichodelitschia bisporula TaxID=703511 RepID=A0A6G1I9V3_9PEZI|nr:HIT-like protein [Trichodelitschia bisporula]
MCYSCDENAASDLPPRESIFVSPHWRVCHSFNSSLPGWLVIVAQKHVLSLDEMPDEALMELGLLQGKLTRALREVVGSLKAYSVFFAEGRGFEHVHIHIVPRMPDQPPDRKGRRVFEYLPPPAVEAVPVEEMDRISRDIASRVRLNDPRTEKS